MQLVTIGRLLESAVSCSSSSKFVSESAASLHVNSPRVDLPVPGTDVLKGIRGKRGQDEHGAKTDGSSKKLKADCRAIKVLPQRWTIVGLLQLCNRSVHSWNGLHVPADCVALTDSTATICCCICKGPDPRLLGKIVRVNSWSFIPKKGSPTMSTRNAGDLCVESLAKIGSAITSFTKYPAAHVDGGRTPSFGSENLDCKLGILEIHSLELVEGQLSEETASPSLFVSPAAPDSRKALVENSPNRQQRKRSGVILRGLSRSISPPFTLPCKLSLDPGASPSRAGISGMPDGEQRSNDKPRQAPMLGFIVEVQYCSSCSPVYIDPWKQVVKQGRHRARPLDEREHSAVISGDCAAASSVMEHIVKTIEQDSVHEKFSSLTKASEPAKTPNSTKGSEAGWSLANVYFSGSVAAWLPVLSGALGRCVTITELRKKLILVGSEKNPYMIYLASPKSLVTLECGRELLGGRLETSPLNMPGARALASTYARMEQNVESNPTNRTGGNVTVDVENCPERKLKIGVEIKSTFNSFCAVEPGTYDPPGHGQEDADVCMERGKRAGMDKTVISFVGTVTDILFQGTLVELDERVWLLLTHQRHIKLHGLRIGAMLSLRDTHAITMKDLMGKSLLLGACMHSHVSVVLFSSLLTESRIQVHSKSLLLKHIQHLSFTSTFWLLSLIGSFRQKFRDIYSNKELLGTKKDPGIIQKYAEKVMAQDVSLERDVFKEFFFHEQFCRLGDRLPSISIIKVPPISNFYQHVEVLWKNSGSLGRFRKCDNFIGFQRRWAERRSLMSKSSLSGQFTSSIMTSEELGVTLLGSLQVCQTSGKLQLIDATGNVDVMIPDLSSSEHLSRTYQVSRFTVVVEGLGKASLVSKEVDDSSISWSSLLKEVKVEPRFPKLVTCYVHFFIRDATHLQDLDWCENVVHSTGLPYQEKRSSWLQKQMQDRWAKKKLHLDLLRGWLRLQAMALPDVCSSGHDVDILYDCIGAFARSDHLFKVVGVRLLLFEWQGRPAASEVAVVKQSSLPSIECSSTTWKSPSGIPLTLACFVIDDGSGPVDCWALGDAAVSMLALVKMAGQLNFPTPMLERIYKNLAVVSDLQSSMELSLEQILCHLVQQYGRIILQNERSSGDSTGSHYLICGDGGKSLNDDEQALLHAVVASACHNGALVVVGGNIPSVEKICSTVCKRTSGPCEARICNRHPSLANDHSRAQMFAHRVESVLCLTDLKKISEHVARLLETETPDSIAPMKH